jgi:predicted PurR-regulated permease PerM
MRVGWQIGFWLGALALLIFLLWLLNAILFPFAAALALGYLLDPVADRLQQLGLNRLAATLLILTLFVLGVTLSLVLIVPILGHQLSNFLQILPSYTVKLQSLITAEAGRLTEGYAGSLFEKLGVQTPASAGEMRASIGDIVSQALQWLGAFLKSLWNQGTALISLFSLIVVTPVVAFYMLLDWDKMIAAIDGLVPPRHRDNVRALAREIDAAMAGFLRGQSLVCLFLGLWYGIGLSLIGLNFGLLIGLVGGVLSFIPYVGSLTVLVLSAIVAIVQAWPDWKLFLMALAIVGTGQFLEGNILSPKLVGESVGLHPVWVMFALFAFGSLFGFTGLILAVPLAAAVGVILRFATARYRESPLYTGVSEPGPASLVKPLPNPQDKL